jgi:hypothetical protein
VPGGGCGLGRGAAAGWSGRRTQSPGSQHQPSRRVLTPRPPAHDGIPHVNWQTSVRALPLISEALQARTCQCLRSEWHRTPGRGWRGCQARSARRLAGRDCGRDRQQPGGLAAAEDHGRALVGQPKPGSWIALATPITDFQRQRRRNVETVCRGGTEDGEVTAEECCIAPRCRVEPFLDQGGAATRRRWPGVSAGLCLGRPARRTPDHTLSRATDQPGYWPRVLVHSAAVVTGRAP